MGDISTDKIKMFFLILNWSNRQQFVQNSNSNSIFNDLTSCISEMNDHNDTKNKKEDWKFLLLENACTNQ
jgi:hypothetical protein